MACARCLTHHRSLVYVPEGMKQARYVAQRRSLDAALSQVQCGVTLEVNEREISFSGKDVFENHEHHDQVATRAPISGRFDQPGVGVVTTVVELVVNAFIEALVPGLEHTLGSGAEARK